MLKRRTLNFFVLTSLCADNLQLDYFLSFALNLSLLNVMQIQDKESKYGRRSLMDPPFVRRD